MTKIFTIDIKDYMPSMAKDTQLDRQYADVQHGYGQITFTGTEEELSKYLDILRKESPSMKIIGVDWDEIIETAVV